MDTDLGSFTREEFVRFCKTFLFGAEGASLAGVPASPADSNSVESSSRITRSALGVALVAGPCNSPLGATRRSAPSPGLERAGPAASDAGTPPPDSSPGGSAVASVPDPDDPPSSASARALAMAPGLAPPPATFLTLNCGYRVLSSVMLTLTSLNRVPRSLESRTLARAPLKVEYFFLVAT